MISSPDQLVAKVEMVAQQKWNELIEPNLPINSLKNPDTISWKSRLSDPFPLDWPITSNTFIFYAQAIGFSHYFTDGEHRGPVWGKLVTKPLTHPEFSLLTGQIKSMGTTGVRPLKTNELKILSEKPGDLLVKGRSPATDRKLKAYYCLQFNLGNIPEVAKQSHSVFFSWLGC